MVDLEGIGDEPGTGLDELRAEQEAAELLRTQLHPQLETGPQMGIGEISSRNSQNRYEREYDGLTISQQWTRLVMGDTSMDEGDWDRAVLHLMRLVAFYTDDVEQAMWFYHRSMLSKQQPFQYAGIEGGMEEQARRAAYLAINTRSKRYRGTPEGGSHLRDYKEDIDLFTSGEEQGCSSREKKSWSRSLDPVLDLERKALMVEYLYPEGTNAFVRVDVAAVARALNVTPRHCRRLLQRWGWEGFLRRDYRRREGKGCYYFLMLSVAEEWLCPSYSPLHKNHRAPVEPVTVATDWNALTDEERQADRDWFTQNSVGAEDDLGVSDIDDEPVPDTFTARYEHEQRVEWNRVTFGSFKDVPWYDGPIPSWAWTIKEDPLFEYDREQEWWDGLVAAGVA